MTLRPLLCKLQKNYLASIKIEGGGVEPVGALLADVRADELNERQVVEALHAQGHQGKVDFVVQCATRRCCTMCTMEVARLKFAGEKET